MAILTWIIIMQILIISSATDTGWSMTCTGTNDPHLCVYAIRTQKCYRYNNETRCDTTGGKCTTNCCNGWSSDLKGNCSIKTHVSRCPISPLDVTKGDTHFCKDNTFCSEGEVCCSNVCTKAIYPDHCWYENEFHTLGETITNTNDICSSCTCNQNGGHVASMSCTKYNCNWMKNKTDIPTNYTPPTLLNTPANGARIRIDVLPTKNIAYFKFSDIYSRDFRGRPLSVDVSKVVFHHCLCTNASDVVNVRTSPDQYGNYNESTFFIDIIDRYKPTFANCPHNNTITTNESISWIAPNAADNVGIRYLYKPDIQNNTKLSPGVYTLLYKAEDWSQNSDICSFTITVNKTPDVPSAPYKLMTSFNLTLIICGSISVVMFLILVLISFYAVISAKKKTASEDTEKLCQHK